MDCEALGMTSGGVPGDGCGRRKTTVAVQNLEDDLRGQPADIGQRSGKEGGVLGVGEVHSAEIALEIDSCTS
jgi:hypothetical protein